MPIFTYKTNFNNHKYPYEGFFLGNIYIMPLNLRLVIISTCIFCGFSYGDILKQNQFFWTSCGIGATYFNDFGITGKFEESFQNNRFLSQIRAIGTYEFRFDLFEVIQPKRDAIDIEVLCGYLIMDSRTIEISLSGGISYLYGTNRGALLNVESTGFLSGVAQFESKKFQTVGIPFDFQFRYTFGKNIGIGFNFIANINKYCSYTGGLVTFSIGKMQKEAKK